MSSLNEAAADKIPGAAPEARVPVPPPAGRSGLSAGESIAMILVSKGLISEQQLRYALRIRAKLGASRTLLGILQELHFVKPEEVRSALKANLLEIPLGALLVELGYLRETDLNTALSLQKERQGTRLGKILLENHFITEVDLVEALSFQLGFESMSPMLFPPDPDALRVAPITWFRSRDCVPLGKRNGVPVMAFADPMDRAHVDAARRLFGENLVVGIARNDEIHQALNRLESAKVGRPTVQNTESFVVQTVNEILEEAIRGACSDVHIEPMKDRLRIRYRKDGVLIIQKELPIDLAPPLVSRLKIMGGADIAEKRRHQDGRIAFEYEGAALDLRMSCYVTIFGEKVVLRLLNNRSQQREIWDVGMMPEVARRFVEDALDAPSGVVMVTGPTGSGKTTTLYAAVHYLNNPQTCIITAEDPVEYVVEGIGQCSINPKINLTFEETLKHMMRQDPDVVVIGEIRDKFSAEIAIQAAMTGHKVLTTFHTEDTIGGLLRLLNMDIEAFLVASTVVAVAAQRLLRRLCPNCAEDQPLTAQQVRQLGYEARDAASLPFKKGRGCSRCQHTGYAGRIPVFELLVLNEMVRDAIITRKTSYEIRRLSIDTTGMMTLLEDAILKATKGMTTAEEIIRHVPRLSKPRHIAMLRKLSGET